MGMQFSDVRQRGQSIRQDREATVDVRALFHYLGLTALTRTPDVSPRCCWDDPLKLGHSVGLS